MTSPEIIYCSFSDEEPVFVRNQRLIQEHRIPEEQQDVRDNFSRVIDGVVEGKRKFLKVAAFPDTYNIPREVPSDPSLSLSVAYEPSELKFIIMSEHSETGSQSPIPAVAKSRAITFEAKLYKSTITNTNQISAILRKHSLEISPTLMVRAPRPDERSYYAPRGSDRLQLAAWSQEHKKACALLPLKLIR